MNVVVREKISNNLNNINYLKENSYWYKYLNRNVYYFDLFERKMKEDYKLTVKDKINKFSNSLDTMIKIIDILN